MPTGWTLTDSSGAAGWAGLDAATRQVAGLLSGPGASFSAGRESVLAGKTLKSEMGQHESAVKSWARREGFLTTAGLGSWAGLLVLASIGLAGILVFNPIGGMRGFALAPGFFGLGAIEVLGIGASTKRTAAGRDLWSRVGGFRRILSTPSAVERFDFSGRQDLYTAYLPVGGRLRLRSDEWADEVPRRDGRRAAHAGLFRSPTSAATVATRPRPDRRLLQPPSTPPSPPTRPPRAPRAAAAAGSPAAAAAAAAGVARGEPVPDNDSTSTMALPDRGA